MKPRIAVFIALALLAFAGGSANADDPSRSQSLAAPTALRQPARTVRLSTTELLFYHVGYGLSSQTEIGVTAAPVGAIVDGKYAYASTGVTDLAVVTGAGLTFTGALPVVLAAHAATFTPSIFQFNVLLGGGYLVDAPIILGDVSTAVRLGRHAKFMIEVLAATEHFQFKHADDLPNGFGIAGFRLFGRSLALDFGVAAYSDILRPGIDYMPVFPLLAVAYTTE